MPYHEIGFFFRAAFEDPAFLERSRFWEGVVDGPHKMSFRWFRLDELEQMDLRPQFVAAELRNLTEETRHIINHR